MEYEKPFEELVEVIVAKNHFLENFLKFSSHNIFITQKLRLL